MLSAERAKYLLSYDAESGVIKWNVNKGSRVKAGDTAGYFDKSNGYVLTRVDRKKYYNHRLAWLLTYGEWPIDEIDHINGDRTDNRIVNLRPVTRSENLKNSRMSKYNSSGITGVRWGKRDRAWLVSVSTKHVGYYKDFFEACCARKSSEREHGYHANHGRRIG